MTNLYINQSQSFLATEYYWKEYWLEIGTQAEGGTDTGSMDLDSQEVLELEKAQPLLTLPS